MFPFDDIIMKMVRNTAKVEVSQAVPPTGEYRLLTKFNMADVWLLRQYHV